MTTSYTTSLGLALPQTGDNANTWGTLVNDSITKLVDSAIAGYVSITMTAADYTLTTGDGTANEARSMLLNIAGAPGAARNVICPAKSKLYFVRNVTTGGYAVTLTTLFGTSVSIPNGRSMVLMCDGTDVREAVDFSGTGNFTNIAYTGTLTGSTGVVNLGSGQFYKDASGNVGVGTTTPGAKLEVYTNSAGATTQNLRLQNAASGANTKAQIGFYTAGATYYAAINGGYGAASPELNFALTSTTPGVFTWVDNVTERMRIDSSGNVGVGTAAPQSALGIGQAASSTGLTFQSTDTTFNSGKVAAVKAAIAGSGNGALVFDTFAGGSGGGERMRISGAGNLTIGGTNDSARLRVEGTTNISTALQLFRSGNACSALWTEASSLRLGVDGSTGFTERMQITSAGNVGVGGAPAYPLDVLHTVTGIAARVRNTSTSVELALRTDAFTAGLDAGNATNGMTFSLNTSEKMRLDSGGNLGIGVTPSYKLESRAANAAAVMATSGAAGSYVISGVGRTAFEGGIGLAGATNNFLTGTVAGDIAFYTPNAANAWYGVAGAGNAIIATNNTERMRIDASGNQINTPSNTPPTLTVNGQMNLTPTSNTNMRISYRGSDGVTRVANITLA